jgi:hypothetical protein
MADGAPAAASSDAHATGTADGEDAPDAGTGFDRATGLKALAGFAVAAVLLYLFGRVIGWAEILGTLGDANVWWVALACLSTTACFVVWTKCWDVILAVVDVTIPFRELVPTYFAATFADYVTPFGKLGGGPFVAYVLSTDDRASYSESLAGVVTADLLNLLPFFLFAAVGAAVVTIRRDLPPGPRALVGTLAVVAVVVPLLVFLGYRRQQTVQRLVVTCLSPVATRTDRLSVSAVRERIDEFYTRLDRIAGDRRALAETLGYAIGGWLLFALPLVFAGEALGVQIDLALVLFIVPASTVAGLTPTPGGLGGVEAAVAGLLVALSPLGPSTAAAVALLYRVASYWYVLLVGGVAALLELRG